MKKYSAINENTGDIEGGSVEAENITEACEKLGFDDYDVQDEDNATAFSLGNAYSVSPDD